MGAPLLDGKGPFGSNVFKNPARYIDSYLVENVQELQTI